MGELQLPVHRIVLDPEDYAYFRDLIGTLAGIHLGDRKHTLVQARLATRAFELGIDTLSEYRAHLERLPEGHAEFQAFVNCLTTNKTDFFRESAHIDHLAREYLPQWRARGHRCLRVWSAACSTGEEPYSLAMALRAAASRAPFQYRIDATDIDTRALETARNGVYHAEKVAAVPPEMAARTLVRGSGGISEWYKVRDDVRASVHFSRLNLARRPYPWKDPFDVIFCRNVLIYFERDLVVAIVEGLFDAAAPGALLCVGHSETSFRDATRWVQIQPSIFRKE